MALPMKMKILAAIFKVWMLVLGVVLFACSNLRINLKLAAVHVLHLFTMRRYQIRCGMQGKYQIHGMPTR